MNVAHSNGNPTYCAFQSYGIMFSRQKLTHAYYAFTSYVGRNGHLYTVFLVLAKLRLISDKMCHLYRKFMSYLRRLLCKMRLIFPHINGLLSSYVPQILLQPVRIIARKFANRLVPHTAVHLHTFLLYGTITINTRIVSNYL